MIIYDASAFFERISRKDIDTNCFILDLTMYEVSNVILKHCSALKSISNNEAISLLKIVSNWGNVIYIQHSDLSEIFSLASSLGLTFYDSAYVYFSKKYNAQLETCDKKIYEKANKMCNVRYLK